MPRNWALSSWGTVLKLAAFSGRLCFGPSLGQRVRFTSPATWLSSAASPIDPQAAAADVTRRFLSGVRRAAAQEAERLAVYLDCGLSLTWSS